MKFVERILASSVNCERASCAAKQLRERVGTGEVEGGEYDEPIEAGERDWDPGWADDLLLDTAMRLSFGASGFRGSWLVTPPGRG